MADGFSRVPVESEVAAGNGEVGGDGQFFAGPQTEQRAVVTDAQAEDTSGLHGRPLANLTEQGEFTLRP
jgi:hypothetical protein